MDDVEAQSDPFIGKVIAGKYRITARIGSGGMSGIYRAEHSFMNRDVALKILPPQLAVDPTSRRRFEHEAKIASQINHPNAVILFDFGVDEDLPFLVMELIEGKTLKEVTQEGARLPLSKIAEINDQVCGALAEAHGLGIIHRDVKPTNIMLRGAAQRVKVLDFGIAKIVNSDLNKGSDLTIAGTIVGTPHYMSPEQGLCRELDLRSDIYSLGVVLYELITGTRPFDAPSTLELLVKHVNTPPPTLRSNPSASAVPEAVEQVVMKCLQKDPANRYQSMDELAEAFRSAVMSGGTGSGQQVKPAGGDAKPVRFGRLQLALLVILITVPLLYLGFRHRGESVPGGHAGPPHGAITGPAVPGTENSGPGKTAPPGPDPRMFQMFIDDLDSKDEDVRYRAAEELLKIGSPEALAAVDQFRLEEENRKKEVEAEKQRQEDEQKKDEARLAEQKRLEVESAKRMTELENQKRELEALAKKAEEERILAEKRTAEMKALAEKQADDARHAAAMKEAQEKEAAQKAAVEKAEAAKLEAERAAKRLQEQKEQDEARRQRNKVQDDEAQAEKARRDAERRRREAIREATRPVTTVPPTTVPPADDDSGQKKKRKRCGPNWCM